MAKGKVGRLVMTESAFFSSASRKECFNELGVEKYINMSTSLVGKDLKSFHVKMWLFTHGIATLIASGAVNLTDEEIREMLSTNSKMVFINSRIALCMVI